MFFNYQLLSAESKIKVKLLETMWSESNVRDEVQSENITFCNGPFWNSTLTWHSKDPDITECFRDTILVGGPCAFLWMIGFPLWAWKVTRDMSKAASNKTLIFSKPRLKGKHYHNRMLILDMIYGNQYHWLDCNILMFGRYYAFRQMYPDLYNEGSCISAANIKLHCGIICPI